MGKRVHQIPAELNNTIPRCPLCGLRLETHITRATETTGTVNISTTSLKHLTENHLITVDLKSKPIQGEVLEEQP